MCRWLLLALLALTAAVAMAQSYPERAIRIVVPLTPGGSPDVIARAQGAIGIGPVGDVAELTPAIDATIRMVRGGAVGVVDVRVVPGYDSQ